MMKRLLGCALLAATFVPAAASANKIDIAATNPKGGELAAIPVTQTFGPGTYNAQVIGKAQGGLYDAWGVAQPSAGNYENRYTISYDGKSTQVNPYNGQRFATALDSLKAFSGIITSFTLDKATAVTFSIPDYLWRDNVGGVSVSVTPTDVPEPAMVGLFGLGAAALVLRRRRRSASAA